MLPGAMFAVAAGLQVGGQILGAFGASQDAKNEAKLAKFNALQALYESEQIKQISRVERTRARETGRRAMGTLIARMGMSGGRIDVGTSLAVAAEAAREIDLNDVMMAWQASMAVHARQQQYAIGMWQSKIIKQRGRMGLLGGLLGAGATAFGSASTYKREYG